MQAVSTTPVAPVCTFTNLDDVRPVLGSDGRGDRILLDQWGIVSGGQFKSLAVENCHVGIKEGRSQSHPFHLGSNPLPFLGLDRVVVNILTLDDPVDGGIELDGLGLVKVTVGFLFLGWTIWSHVKSAVLRDTRGSANLGHMLSQAAVIQHLDGSDHASVGRLKLDHFNAGTVKENLLGIGQTGASESEIRFHTTLDTSRGDATE